MIKKILLFVLISASFSLSLGQQKNDELETIAIKIADLFRLFARLGSDGSIQRPVFLKPHACAMGTFSVSDNLPAEFKVGLFSKAFSKPVLVRFSSDTRPSVSDYENNTIGMALKIYDIPGEKVLIGEENSTEHDFLTQNHDVFFVDTAQDFLDFTQAIVDGKLDNYLSLNPRTSEILDDMAKLTKSVLANTYWSPVPFKFGNTFAKYKIIPCQKVSAQDPPENKDNYLRDRLEEDLKENGACFYLQVQLKQDNMPVDQATVRWEESLSQPITVAQITLPKNQDINRHNIVCERSAFNPGRTLPEHEPVGSINKARQIIYKMIADYRRGCQNGESGQRCSKE